MTAHTVKKFLTALLLGTSLVLSSLALADHLHDNLKDEMSCELCSVQSQAAMPEDICSDQPVPAKTAVGKERPRIPFETFRLGERPRGPPLH